MRKKKCVKNKKNCENRKIRIEERGTTHFLFSSICAVVLVYITAPMSESKKWSVPSHFDTSG